jgi:hypothetical protein
MENLPLSPVTDLSVRGDRLFAPPWGEACTTATFGRRDDTPADALGGARPCGGGGPDARWCDDDGVGAPTGWGHW